MDLVTDASDLDSAGPRYSGWRRAVVAFSALGAGVFALGQLTYQLDFPTFVQRLGMFSVLAPALALLGLGLWWLAFGPLGRVSRLLVVLAVGAATGAVLVLAQGEFGPPLNGMKVVALLWGVPFAVATTGLALAAVRPLRGWGVVPVAALAVSPLLLLRSDGVNGRFLPELSYRWSASAAEAAAEQLADRATVAASTIGETIVAGPASWPGFRGADRAGTAPAAAFAGWNGTAPRERWRKSPIGPAWSSVCVVGDVLFTQEQRGESESVVCYRTGDGSEVWARGDSGKHTDWASGSGPRATPTFADGKLFVTTASGTVLALKAESGEILWRVDLLSTFGAVKPVFGFSASPLVIGDLVIVSPSAPAAPRLVALSTATGEVKWQTEDKGTPGYSSPQLSTIAGVPQILLFNGDGLIAHAPATGAELWRYDWKTSANDPATVQPLVLPGDRIVIGGGNKGLGTRCLAVKRIGTAWSVAAAWSTTKFTPIFNDVVCCGNSLFGLDAGRLVNLDLANGSIRWREGNYGSGQLLLVGDKLLVVSEKGQLACVAATGEEFEEVWAVPAVSGKTWNHPVVAGGRVYVRNATELVSFDLPGCVGVK